MRILIADTYYEPFIEQHYGANPGLAGRPYAEQLASLMDRQFGTADAYSRNLRALGHEAAEVIVNCAPLQARWDREQRGGWARRMRGLLGSAGPDLNGIARAQIRNFEPDVLYVQNLWSFSRPDLDAIRAEGVTAVGQIASPPPADEVVAGYDLIVTSFPHFVERFEALGVRTRHLDLAFDERVIERLRQAGADPDPGSERPHRVSFVGGLDPRVHPGRVALMEKVGAGVGLETWGYGADRLDPASPLRAIHHGEAWGLDMYRVLADSRIVINTHIEAAEGHANNMRLYEATGCGAVVITENAPNLSEILEPGREVVTYTGPDELAAKVRELLADDEARSAIAAAGQERTLGEHTYARRMAELTAMLEGVRR